MSRGKDREENYLFKELLPFGGAVGERESVVEDQGNDPVGGVGKRVREIFFMERAARTRWTDGDRIIFVEAYERQE